MINFIRINLFILAMFCVGCATNGVGENTASAVDNSLATVEQAAQAGRQTVESGLATAKNISASQSSLPETLVNQLGVSQQQALGGAGAIFQAAKRNMEPQAFATLSQSVPGINNMLGAAPTLSNSVSNITDDISSMVGSTNNTTLESIALLASSFKQLNLSPNMVNQFIPIVTNYVRVNGGQAMASLLQSALR